MKENEFSLILQQEIKKHVTDEKSMLAVHKILKTAVVSSLISSFGLNEELNENEVAFKEYVRKELGGVLQDAQIVWQYRKNRSSTNEAQENNKSDSDDSLNLN